jgi:dipeptidyl aminopeptidase/acylaminoacyl peptidase
MALTVSKLTLPRGAGSLRQLTQSATHLVRVDGSGASYLVDLGAKKPEVHELPSIIIPGKGSNPDRALGVEGASFAPDGKRLALIRGGMEGRPLAIELLDVATRQATGGFALKLASPSNVQWHPDGERLIVHGRPETYVFSLGGKVLDRIGTQRRFELSPDGTHFLFENDDAEWMTRPVAGPKFQKFEARDATWADGQTVVFTRWAPKDQQVVFTLAAASGKAKKLTTIPPASSLGAQGSRAVAVEAGEKKVAAIVIDLASGKKTRHELQGSPSGTAVSVGAERAFVSVNWAKVVHQLAFKR